jgi:FAD:protein FMN transferase
VFDRVDRVMNEWRPDSPLSALNASASAGRWTWLPSDLCQVLQLSVAGAERTGGLFDPTWAALRALWEFGTGGSTEPPSDRAVADVCPLVSYRGLDIAAGREGCRAGMQVGLGGIAKGWAVDRAVAALRARGLRDFTVQAGGDLYVAGHRQARPWVTGIRDPRGTADEPFASVEVTDHAFSTSGDYEHFFVSGARRYHHIIDPRTCRPAQASRSVSVFARTATDAEILSKAPFIRGGREGLALVERAGAAAVIVTADNEVLVSRALAHRIRWRAPTP